MIEAELKARLSRPAEVRGRLDGLAAGSLEVYRDIYFDTPAADLDRSGRELRLRTIATGTSTRHVLTFKGPPVDQVSQSKPEHEATIDGLDAVVTILGALGYPPALTFRKECVNYRFECAGRKLLATLVTVPEIEGVFLEVETIATEDDLAAALAAVRAVLANLGVTEAEITTDTYTDAVRAARPG